MIIRHATEEDLSAITALEAECFPPSEAAKEEDFIGRLKYYKSHFSLMLDSNKLIDFLDGFVTDEKDLNDEMYDKPEMHNENGAWQMIFGVNTLPEYRKHGYASQLIEHMINEARAQGRKGLVLTCKEKRIPFYSKFGFINEGISKSVHGNVIWYQMRLTF